MRMMHVEEQVYAALTHLTEWLFGGSPSSNSVPLGSGVGPQYRVRAERTPKIARLRPKQLSLGTYKE